MSEREKIEIVTPVGQHKVELKAWLTGRERRAIRSVYYQHMKLSAAEDLSEKVLEVPSEADAKLNATYDIDGSTIASAQDAQISNVVISVNGVKEKVLDTVLDMRDEDTQFVLAEVSKIINQSELSEADKKK